MQKSVDESVGVIILAQVLVDELYLLFATSSGAQFTDAINEIVDYRKFLIIGMEREIVEDPA